MQEPEAIYVNQEDESIRLTIVIEGREESRLLLSIDEAKELAAKLFDIVCKESLERQ